MGYEIKKEFIDTILNRDIKYIQEKRKQEENKTISKFVESEVASQIRESIKNDYTSLKKMFGTELERFKKDEIDELLTVLIAKRGEENVFYRNYSKDMVNPNRSIHVQIRNGKLEYRYEDNYNMIIRIYNQLYSKKIPENVEEVILEKTFELQYLLVKYIEVTVEGREDKIKELWENVKTELGNWCELIHNICSDDMKHNLLSAWVGIDLLEGYIRDILLNLTRMYNNEGVIESYAKGINEDILKRDKKENTRSHYHLIQSYTLQQYLYAIQGEKKTWIVIRKFLLSSIEKYNEKIDGNAKKERIKFERHQEDVELIFKWLIYSEMYLPTMNELIIMNAIYKECFLIKEIIPEINRRGIGSFVAYLKDKTSNKYPNLSDTEMFYYEKIIRGIYVECGEMELYIQETNRLLKLYDAELNMIQHEYMKGNYLEKWANIIKSSFCKTIENHLITLREE